jgi:plasmid stabilization system protein ParE
MDKRPYSYVFSSLAADDLNGIFDYITLDLLAPQAAERLIDSIQLEVENLCHFPFSQPLLNDRLLRKKGYRILVVQNFNLFYVVKENTIIIRRVLHSRRNFFAEL